MEYLQLRLCLTVGGGCPVSVPGEVGRLPERLTFGGHYR